MKRKYSIQLHDASHLHYDLRLEINGKLASWAIPKGPSLNPKEKRLAIKTPDHEISYVDFEGIIKEGYGKGTVLLWDEGWYEPKNNIPMEKQLQERKIEIFIHGKKLKGLWALIGFKEEEDMWLFFKMHDQYEDKDKNIIDESYSTKTKRTLKQIEQEES